MDILFRSILSDSPVALTIPPSTIKPAEIAAAPTDNAAAAALVPAAAADPAAAVADAAALVALVPTAVADPAALVALVAAFVALVDAFVADV